MSGTSTFSTKSSKLSAQHLNEFKKGFCRLARQFYSQPLATFVAMYKPLIHL